MAAGYKPCSITGCNGNANYSASGKRGWCNMHYRRWQRYGDTSFRVRPPNGEVRLYFKTVVIPYSGETCLIWPFARNEAGYGVINLPGASSSLVSRIVCEATHGEAPSDTHEAAHSCGKGHEGCVSPMHLSWKTPSQNSADKHTHGTTSKGTLSPLSKLDEASVIAIRRMAGSMTQVEIAAHFGVARTTVSSILHGRNWSWL